VTALVMVPSAGVNEQEAAIMRRTILIAVVLPFVSAFLGAALAFSLVAAPQATAGSGQLQEVRASAFTLVGADGTVLAELAPGTGGGAGRLLLRDAAGTQRVTLVGSGTLNVWDQEGATVVFRAGRVYDVLASSRPPFNGVELGPGGSIGMIESPR
jgi:hypothetical protein